MPSQWTDALAGQQPQGILERPLASALGLSSTGRAPSKTGSAGGNATIRDLLINQSCREAASGGYNPDLTACFSPTLCARRATQVQSKAGQHPQLSPMHQPPFPHPTDPLLWHHSLDSFFQLQSPGAQMRDKRAQTRGTCTSGQTIASSQAGARSGNSSLGRMIRSAHQSTAQHGAAYRSAA